MSHRRLWGLFPALGRLNKRLDSRKVDKTVTDTDMTPDTTGKVSMAAAWITEGWGEA